MAPGELPIRHHDHDLPTPAPVPGSLILEVSLAPPSTTSGAPSNTALDMASTSDGGYSVGKDGSDVDPICQL